MAENMLGWNTEPAAFCVPDVVCCVQALLQRFFICMKTQAAVEAIAILSVVHPLADAKTIQSCRCHETYHIADKRACEAVEYLVCFFLGVNSISVQQPGMQCATLQMPTLLQL